MPKTSPVIHTPETLRAVIQEIADASADIRAATESMSSLELERVRVETGQAELKRALAGLKNFGMHLKRAMNKARQDRGDFGSEVTKDGPPKANRSPKKSA